MHGLLTSAPFGNYIAPSYVTPTLWTFTLEKRPGRVKQIIKTVRYSWTLDAWVNKIGLRNPGIMSLWQQKNIENKIISIHGFDTEEWITLLNQRIPDLESAHIEDARTCTWELNMSCPNVKDKPLDYLWIFGAAHRVVPDSIVKLPPVGWQPIFSAAINSGLYRFHCCNTLPTQVGGISGAPLKNYSLNVIREIRKAYPRPVGDNKLFIIGGGGIRGQDDITKYRDAGADRVAVASALFNPFFCLFKLKSLAKYADELFLNQG